MKKRYFVVILTLVLSLSTVATAFAADNSTMDLGLVSNENNIELSDDSIVSPMTDGHTYWRVDSKTNLGTVYGTWRLGPQGAGPGSISVNKTDSVTNTISGSYTSKGAISSSLGCSIGVSNSYAVAYSLPVPKGHTWQIKYRPLYYQYKVVENQYFTIDGYSVKTGESKVCYVVRFYDWGFNYNVIK